MSSLILPARPPVIAAEDRPDRGKCRDCRHRHMGNGREVECRARSPQATIVMVPAPPPHVNRVVPQIIACFPLIEDGWWCGEFVRRIDA